MRDLINPSKLHNDHLDAWTTPQKILFHSKIPGSPWRTSRIETNTWTCPHFKQNLGTPTIRTPTIVSTTCHFSMGPNDHSWSVVPAKETGQRKIMRRRPPGGFLSIRHLEGSYASSTYVYACRRSEIPSGIWNSWHVLSLTVQMNFHITSLTSTHKISLQETPISCVCVWKSEKQRFFYISAWWSLFFVWNRELKIHRDSTHVRAPRRAHHIESAC